MYLDRLKTNISNDIYILFGSHFITDDILNNRVSLPNFQSNVLFFKSVKSRKSFGRGYAFVTRLGKSNFYSKTSV